MIDKATIDRLRAIDMPQSSKLYRITAEIARMESQIERKRAKYPCGLWGEAAEAVEHWTRHRDYLIELRRELAS